MPTAYQYGRIWINDRGTSVAGRLDAALELAVQMRPRLSALDVSMRELQGSEPGTFRTMADDVGLTSIASRRGLSADDVLEAFQFLLDVGYALTTSP